MKNKERNLLRYYIVQTIITSVIIGYLAVDPAYKGFEYFIGGASLSLCLFITMFATAMSFYDDVVKERRKDQKHVTERLRRIA